jgi:outer membrane protein assembly factor BamD (BamD/ComL family)
MDADPRIPSPRRRARRAAWLPLAAAVVAAGCQGSTGLLSRWRTVRDGALAPPPTAEEAGDRRGPLAQLLDPGGVPPRGLKIDDQLARVSGETAPTDPAVEAEFRSAEELMEAGRHDDAEKILVKLDRKSEQGVLGKFFRGEAKPADDGPVTPSGRRSRRAAWGQKALFLLAESQYAQGKLVAANDSYVKLMSAYPTNRYAEQVARREYEIAVAWLEAIDAKSPPEKRERLGDRFNGRLPLADVAGNAIQVLEHVRHHDVDGELADDAVLRIADHYYAAGEYEDAAGKYDELIQEHPKSPLLQTAYLRTIDAKLKAYMGPSYDVAGLDAARDQIHQAMTLFPERQASTTDALSHALDLIEDQQAEILYRRGEFYQKTGYPGAAELCYGEVKTRWPRTDWAPKASQRLEEIARMPRKAVEPSKMMGLPGAGDPFSASAPPPGMSGGMGGMGGMPMGGNGP